MKQEKEAPVASSSPFKNVKEVEANARTRMDKVQSDLSAGVVAFPDRTRIDHAAGQCAGGLFRYADAAEPGGAVACSGACDDYGSAVGHFI